MTNQDIDFITRYIPLGDGSTINYRDGRFIATLNEEKLCRHSQTFNWIREYLNTGAVAERLPSWFY